MRRRSEIDPDKYNQIVVADEQANEPEYKSDYRGKVQNRSAALTPLPMYHLSYMQYVSDVHNYHAFATKVEEFNMKSSGNRIYVNCQQQQLDVMVSRSILARVDSLSTVVNRTSDHNKLATLLLQRAVGESVAQDYDAAIADLTTCLSIDSTSVLALWQRAYCQMRMSAFDASVEDKSVASATSVVHMGDMSALKSSKVMDDLNRAIALDADNQYLYYNRGNIYMSRKDYIHAIDDYTRAINIDHNLAEAYYNRGLARVANGLKSEGIADLSKAGELGLYGAYSVIKRISTN